MKQVPEETLIPNNDEQLDSLVQKLLGNKIFGRVRGQFKAELPELIKLIDEADSPSDFCRRFDRWAADQRMMGNLLAQLRRDRWSFAEGELTTLLCTAGYTLAGETVPLEETVPVTLIIPDFDRTLVMLRWIMSHGVSLFDGGDHTPELQHAFEGSFPTYRQHMDARRDPHVYPGREIITAYRDAVLTPLGIDPTKLAANVRALQMANETHSDDFEIGGNFNGSVCFGFLYVDEDQGSALSKFTREQQSQMASWQFNLPRALELSYYKIRFGFKPERSCDKQVRGGGTFSAPGFSQGFGSTAFLKFDGDRNRGQIRNFMYQES